MERKKQQPVFFKNVPFWVQQKKFMQ